MTRSLFLILAAATGGLAFATAAPAQQNDRTLVIYGNDRCPEGTICVRAPESDRYRIPEKLRSTTLSSQDQPWGAKGASVARAGASSGTGSCSAAGGGGFTGCWSQDMKAARDERRQQNAADAGSVEPH